MVNRRYNFIDVEHNILKIAVQCKKHIGFKNLAFIDKILYIAVTIMINYDLQNNVGKFKVGDTVKYNWKARVYLGHVYREGKKEQWVIDRFYCNGENWESSDGKGSSVFWAKKANN